MEVVYNDEYRNWLSGFIDGEGCFSVSFSLRKKMKHGFEIKPSFSCAQKRDKHSLNLKVLEDMKAFFQSGFIRFSKADQVYKYEVRDIDELWKKIIPHFVDYPLKTSKQLDFEKFKEVCQLIKSNHHFSLVGARSIIKLAFLMNSGGTRKYSQELLLRLLDEVKI